MSNIVYKIVSKNGHSLMEQCLPDEAVVFYRTGRTSKPKILGSRLFAFSTRKSAENYLERISSCDVKLYKAKATGIQNLVVRLPMPVDVVDLIDLREFWENEDNHRHWNDVMPTPVGTVICDTITPIKLLNICKN